jgi:hypothetical protein
MATDVFGDLSLFDEFEKDRSSSASFITFNITNEGNEDKSKILFKVGASDDESSESSSESDSESETENRINGTKVKDDDDDISNAQFDIKESTKPTSYKLLHDRILETLSCFECIVTVCVFVCDLFSFYPLYFDFHCARIIFHESSGFYLSNINKTRA